MNAFPTIIPGNENTYEGAQNGALIPQVHQSVIIDLSVHLPCEELTKLYRSIESALPNIPNRVVQFASAYVGEGASTIAFETAIVTAQIMGKRVLYIDTCAVEAGFYNRITDTAIPTSLDRLLLAGRMPYEAIAQVAGTELYITRLRALDKNGFPAASIAAVERAIANLRTVFDLIVIDSPAILRDAFAISFAKLANGTILVVEAERTRAPVAMEVRHVIESGGGRVIGAVLSKRRFYIPRFIYRLFYRNIASV